MEVGMLIVGILSIVVVIGATAWVIWSNRNQKNNERIWERFDLLVTRDDMEKWVEMSQRPITVKLDAISTELRGIRARLD